MTTLITGATGAIGSALAAQLAATGTPLLLVARDAGRLDALTAQLGSAASVTTLALDLRDSAAAVPALQAALAAALAAGRPVNRLAHCVGSTVVRPLHLTQEADWREQFEINATTAFTVLKLCVTGAIKAPHPLAAVLVSSVVAHGGFANHEAIGAAKAAVAALALGTAASYADKGVRVNVVAPGLTRSTLTQRFIATPAAEARSAALIPSGRIGEPGEVAATIGFLLSDAAAHITGQVLQVSGGQGSLHPLPKA
ncbi:SDR family NAD(P)-dependent oxidoreductase [Derxia lacustris]|uniref:SDR family NAD(P)-dependent oxidoreductase n=1 Tax=Derxia lacustris TaxID=764842 RepID=UPI00111C2E21|nr:SDR family oxidoreductase [Derxia lacustris]